MPAEPEEEGSLRELIEIVGRSAKYRAVSTDLVAAVGRRALARRPTLATAIKETKSALHQAGGAYLEARVRYDAWLESLKAAHATGQPQVVRAACRAVMAHHASTRERLELLEIFYATTLASLPPLRSVIDVGCGLNPLAAPWMPLAENATYRALDIYEDMAAFLDAALPLLGVAGSAVVHDAARLPIVGRADMALVLKVLPVLEHQEKGAGLRLLRSLDAPLLLVSFPARSLGGRERGMVRTYAERFTALVEAEGWSAQPFVFATELAFLVRKASLCCSTAGVARDACDGTHARTGPAHPPGTA